MKRILACLFVLASLLARAEKFYPAPNVQVCWYNGAGGFCSPPNGLGAGDTIVFVGGQNYITFQLGDYHGTEGDSIVVINEGGRANIRAMAFENCTYVRVVFDGTPGLKYGMKIEIPEINTTEGIAVTGRSSHFNIGNFENYGTWSGVKIKHDYGNSQTSINYPDYVMTGFKVHDIYARNGRGDLIYIGNTNPQGLNYGDGLRQPIRLKNVQVWNIDAENIERTVIQIGLTENAEVFGCKIRQAGTEFNIFQGVGIAVGGSSTNVHIRDNDIRGTFKFGIQVFGYDSNFVYRNRTDSSGMIEVPQYMDGDSIAQVLDQRIRFGYAPWGWGGNTQWNQGNFHIYYDPVSRRLHNTYDQPSGVTVQPDWHWYPGGTHPANQGAPAEANPQDSSKVIIQDNRIGTTICLDANRQQFYSTSVNRISFGDNGKVPFSYFQYISGNKDENGVAAVTPSTGGKHYFSTPVTIPPYYEMGGTGGSVAWKPPVLRLPRAGRIIRK